MMSIIVEELSKLPELENIFQEIKPIITILIQQFQKQMGEELDQQSTEKYRKQFLTLFKNLKTIGRISILKDQNHRKLIIQFIKRQGIEHYKYSYYNRAKLSKIHFKRLEQVGPILFSEAVMIASKINIINKNSSRIFIEDHLYTQKQSPVDMRIQDILKLCDQKKRNANNNFKKLQLILEGPDYLQVIKELGKMLRDSWKKDKCKIKCNDFVKDDFRGKEDVKNYNNNFKQQEDQDNEKSQINSVNDKKSINSDKLSFASSQKEIIYNILNQSAPKNEYQLLFDLENSYDRQQPSLFDRYDRNDNDFI